MQLTPTMDRAPARTASELDEWLEVLSPGIAVDERAAKAGERFARSLRRIVADAAVELLVDELEEALGG